jgi:hypothetical protein
MVREARVKVSWKGLQMVIHTGTLRMSQTKRSAHFGGQPIACELRHLPKTCIEAKIWIPFWGSNLQFMAIGAPQPRTDDHYSPPIPPCERKGVLLRLLLRLSPSTEESRFARLRLSSWSSDRIMDILCVYCFDVLGAELDKRAAIPFPAAHLAKTNPKLLTNGDAESHDVVSIDTN